MNQQLLDYIKESSAKGAGQEQISEVLIKAGWKKEDVSDALKSLALKPAPPEISPKTAPVVTAASQSTQTKPVDKTKPINKIKAEKFHFNFKNKFFIIFISLVGVSIVCAGVFAAVRYYFMPSQKNAPIEIKNTALVPTSTEAVKYVDNSGEASSSLATSSLDLASSSLATSSVLNTDIIADVSSSSLTVSSIVIHQPGVTVNNPASGTVISYDGAAAAALDSDNDGLTDAEEAIYGTDPKNPDSDGDGYLDGAEVKSGYNPLGAGKLIK